MSLIKNSSVIITVDINIKFSHENISSVFLNPIRGLKSVVQFKTDSVNPGKAISDFKMYEVGFQNNIENFHWLPLRLRMMLV